MIGLYKSGTSKRKLAVFIKNEGSTINGTYE